MLNEGDTLPSFSCVNQDGEARSETHLNQGKVLVFFYPKDNTPGCTAAACSLRDTFGELQAKGISMFGVSPDSPKKHQNFIKKYEFPFELWSDEEHDMMNAFGVWGPKKFMGRTFDGVHRTSFLIEDGVIKHIFRKVKTKTHAEQVLDELT